MDDGKTEWRHNLQLCKPADEAKTGADNHKVVFTFTIVCRLVITRDRFSSWPILEHQSKFFFVFSFSSSSRFSKIFCIVNTIWYANFRATNWDWLFDHFQSTFNLAFFYIPSSTFSRMDSALVRTVLTHLLGILSGDGSPFEICYSWTTTQHNQPIGLDPMKLNHYTNPNFQHTIVSN